ncbi:MAG: hypothetical protein LBP67_02345 [Bacteroidales bacterium]|nr:hypothetical protein [Bacteroidales bacterium]
MLFVSTAALSQLPVSSTFVRDYPIQVSVYDLNSPVTVTLQWVGSNGLIMERSVLSTVAQVGSGVHVYQYELFQYSIYPIQSTIITVVYGSEYHIGRYNGFVSNAIRANDPGNWQVYF